MGTADSDVADDIKGVIPRAAEALFEKLRLETATHSSTPSLLQSPHRYSTLSPLKSSSPKQNWQLNASYVEIYNEQFRDLLVADSVPNVDRSPINIREDTKGRIFLSGLTQKTIDTPADLLAALEFGSHIRQTDATGLNAKSSRSHAIFTLNLVRKDKPDSPSSLPKDKRFSMPLPRSTPSEPTEIHSKLNFVDLAGSERLKHTGAQGERAKEGISINAGLASLGKVIAQLSARQPGHVSYRDSRLTRLLQDSLGGNAITYMLACVTPAEFHLTETLNTLHYAQRARAIQSKPEIQRHTSGDSDVRVQRLQAEIALLRDQLKNDTTHHQSPDDKARNVRRAIELQEQLLDMQQRYEALNSRHALLIEELGHGKYQSPPDTPLLDQISANAGERLQRSTSFAEAVEQVVSEYEKTIEGLEVALANARLSLSSFEGQITDKDLKLASMQSTIQQMQGRLQILTDRDATNEAYLQRLESEVETATSGEEKSAALLAGLRAELAKSKETQSGSEAYIAALEERLAEAEQDHTIMRRELDRLEQVVERQRSVGRLDSLIGDLHAVPRRQKSQSSARHHDDQSRDISPSPAGSELEVLTTATSLSRSSSLNDGGEQSSAQFLADKLESLTQELFDLRLEHETALTDHDELQRKYRLALETLAIAQEEKAVPTADADPFLGGSPSGETDSTPQRPSPSRSLSSPSPSRKDSTGTSPTQIQLRVQTSDDQAPVSPTTATVPTDHDELVKAHQDALSQIDNLKKELFRARINASPAPVPSPRKSPLPLLRRKPSQDVPIILNSNSNERTNRSFASLRNISLDHFESNPELRQTFDTQLNQLMSDMHDRNAKLQETQLELASIRKDLDTKTTMLAGLTRERSSMMRSTEVDFTVVGKMQEQLEQSETQLKTLQETSANTEAKLQDRIKHLETQLANDFDNDTPLDIPGSFDRVPSMIDTKSDGPVDKPNQETLAKYETELSDSRSKITELQDALKVMTDKEQKSDRLVQELEEQLSSTYDQQQASTKRISAVQSERQQQLEDAQKAKQDMEKEMEEMRQRIIALETFKHEERHSTSTPTKDGLGVDTPTSPQRRVGRSASASSLVRRSSSPTMNMPGATALPSPPPDIPLPPLPGVAPAMASPISRVVSPLIASPRPESTQTTESINLAHAVEERERRIRTVEKHLFAEKQLTATLEEALVDLETAQAKTRSELDTWRKRCTALEDEMVGLRNEKTSTRSSLQAVEEEREMRLKAERARSALEERMRELTIARKKKKNALNCFA